MIEEPHRLLRRRDFLIGASTVLATPSAFADVPVVSDLRRAARDAWLFVLPLIEVAALRARPDPISGASLPMNIFRHAKSLAGPMNRTVTTPNNDTLYSIAFVDTTKGPVRMEVPDCGNRYSSVQIMDMYTKQFHPQPAHARRCCRQVAPHRSRHRATGRARPKDCHSARVVAG